MFRKKLKIQIRDYQEGERSKRSGVEAEGEMRTFNKLYIVGAAVFSLNPHREPGKQVFLHVTDDHFAIPSSQMVY